MKLKHNKKRNTAFLFESLVRGLTKASIKNDLAQKKKILNILREFFKKEKILAKELELYKALYETSSLNEKDAEKLINEIKRVYLSMNQQKVFNAQTKLINWTNKTAGPEVFSNFIPNYKTLASISQIFNKSTPVKSRVILERQIIKQITLPTYKMEQSDAKINYSTLRIFSKKFNSSYDKLFLEQKELLSKYVGSFQDSGLELKIYLNEELARLKKEIKESFTLEEFKNDSEMRKKIEKVLKTLESFKEQFITEDMLKTILKTQQLMREIRGADSNG